MLDTDRANAAGTRLAESIWGGIQVQLVIDAKGGKLALSCAEGAFSGPILLDRDGKFSASGTFDQHMGGPQVADEAFHSAKARFSGQVKGDMMDLTVMPAGSRTPQKFHLRKGARSKLIRCL